jgi:CheY-like chemotaxis protein
MQCVQAPATPEALQMDTSTASLQGCFVVVVDDEAQVRQALAILLKQWGCEVVTASSGEEAVQQLAEHTRVPDILLCDYRLREQATGLDAIQLLRTEFCDDIPALLITGDTAAERLQALRQSGLPVLHKPLRPQALYTAITQNRRG